MERAHLASRETAPGPSQSPENSRSTRTPTGRKDSAPRRRFDKKPSTESAMWPASMFDNEPIIDPFHDDWPHWHRAASFVLEDAIQSYSAHAMTEEHAAWMKASDFKPHIL